MMYEALEKEISFRMSRSSGAGGQHVNKVSTKVELVFDVLNSAFLTDEQKELILENLKNRISKNGFLLMQSDETRSQAKNKALVLERFFTLIEAALRPQKPREPTVPTKSSVKKRLKEKKKIAAKKELRKIKPEQE